MDATKKIYKVVFRGVQGRGLGRIPIFSYANSTIKHAFTKAPVYVIGHKMFLDRGDSLNILANGVYEPYQTKLSEALIKKGNTVLDVGANIGYYTLLFARGVGTRGRVVSFEPEVTNFKILSKNVLLNRYNNVSLIKKAVSDKTGLCTLHINSLNSGSHTIGLSNGRGVLVETIKLDDLEDLGNVDLLKMDAEGSEPAIFSGMKKIISESKNIKIITEFNPAAIKACGFSPSQFILDIKKSGFSTYMINEKEKKLDEIKEIESLNTVSGYTNLLCMRGSRNVREQTASF